MGFGRSILIWLAASATAFAGPYSDEYGGLDHATGACFRGWISGYLEYNQPDPYSGGLARDNAGSISGVSNAIVGRPEDFSTDSSAVHVLSLGNGGSIVLTFNDAIEDAAGPDFAVFENGFTDNTFWGSSLRSGSTNTYCFSELAFVEVATHTSSWARFPVICLNTSVVYNLDLTSSNYFASQDVTLLDGVAGKHRIEYGTPFDLSALTNDPAVLNSNVDLHCIRYIRLTDVVGDGSTADSQGRAIYDPYYDSAHGYPNTPVQSALDGFDLRAVGIIHFVGVTAKPMPQGMNISWFAGTGTTYQVQWSKLDGPSWNDVGSQIAGDDSMHSITDSAPESVRVYRLLENREGGL